ncbi:hypothetical protein EPN52_13450 [bacterium]|nr:MAG: hypothetical protein EPN52_13450 [bacterium]
MPATYGRRTVERRRFIGALAASACLHAVAIAVWLSLFAGLLAGVPTPTMPRVRVDVPSAQTSEVLFTSIEFRPRVALAPHRVTPPRPRRARPLPSPPAPQAVARVPARAVQRPIPRPVPPPPVPAVAKTEVAPTAAAPPAALPAETPSTAPTPAPKVAEAGLWGLDSAPVLLDRIAALLGDVHRQLHIEIDVDSRGRATGVRVDDPNVDHTLLERVVNTLLTAHYEAARCNNLPCPGELVFAYP